MIIAQITDLHVVGRNRLCYGRVPTNAQLQEAVAHINGLRPRPDVVIASGDLTDHGFAEEYEVLREILSALVPPLYVVPGNHDNRDLLLKAFSDQVYLAQHGAPSAHYAIEAYPVRLIGLDTTVSGHHHGLLCEKRLAWLEETLTAEPHRPTLIFMHHPPFRTGIQWMDGVGLYGGRKMEEIISRHPQVARVACGHLHRTIQVAWGGTIASTTPSTCHQVALNLGETGAFELVMEPRTVQLHVLDPGYGLVSHTSYVSGDKAFLPTSESEKWTIEALMEVFRRTYEELCLEEFEALSPARLPKATGGF